MEKNPKGTITLNEAMQMLKGKSNITKMGLRTAAKRDNFKSKHIGLGKENFLLDTVKFEQWISNNLDAIPEGFIPVGKAAKELDITSSYVYQLIRRYKIETRKLGAGRGKVYIDFFMLQALTAVKNKKFKALNYSYEPSNDELREAVSFFSEYVENLKTKNDWRYFLKAVNHWKFKTKKSNKR